MPCIGLFHDLRLDECIQTLRERDLGHVPAAGHRQGQIHETVVCRGCLIQKSANTRVHIARGAYLVARQTLEPIAELALEKIHYQAVVAHSIDLPLLVARDLLWQSLEFGFLLCRWLPCGLMQDTVEILV